jgi:hypothetical protein
VSFSCHLSDLFIDIFVVGIAVTVDGKIGGAAMKLNPDGDVIWSKVIYGTARQVRFSGCAVTDDAYFALGYSAPYVNH